MPFRLDEYDRAFDLFVWDTAQGLAYAQSPLLRMIPVEAGAGTGLSVVEGRDVGSLDLPPRPVEFEVSMDVQAVRRGDFEVFVAEVTSAAEQLGRGLVELLITNLNRVTSFTGNVVDAGGEFTFEAFYEALDKMEWSLADDGELSLPTLVMHPDMVKKLPALTAEQEAALGQLKQRKHEELLARRRNRRLS